MKRFAVISIAALSGIVAYAAAVASFQPRENAEGSVAALRINGLHASIRSEPEQWNYVENGGHGEKIHLYISLSTSDANWERLAACGGLEFDAKPALIRILARNDGGPEFEIEPFEFRVSGMRGDDSGAEWSCGGDVSLSKIIQQNRRPPREVAFRVALSEHFIGRNTRVEQAEGLASNVLRIKLHPQPFFESTFTRRLYSLAPGITTDEVRRILGEPISDSPVEPELQEYYSDYAREWVYRNPDLKDFVLADRIQLGLKLANRYPDLRDVVRPPKNRDLVTLYFDANGRLIGYAQSIYDC